MILKILRAQDTLGSCTSDRHSVIGPYTSRHAAETISQFSLSKELIYQHAQVKVIKNESAEKKSPKALQFNLHRLIKFERPVEQDEFKKTP